MLLNEQTRMHTTEQFASFIDVLFCRLEQLILQYYPSVEYFFDNQTIRIYLSEDIHRMDLPIEIFRFIRYVNEQTQWNVQFILAIDIHPFSSEFLRWLHEDCSIKDRIYLSSRILLNNPEYQLTLINPTSMYYSFVHEKMFEKFPIDSLPSISSDMIDQLTRIEAEYHVDKHLRTISLIRQRSLFQISSQHFHWLTLNFFEESLRNDFQSLHRSVHPQRILYLLYLFILLNIFIHSSNQILLVFPLGILLLILSFNYYYIRHEQSSRTFTIYFNLLICLTLTSTLFVGIQYQSIHYFKSLRKINSNEFFPNQFHQYLILCPIYPLYFCVLFRQCSWMIKTSVILICSILQIYVYEYIWWSTRGYFPKISSMHHYTVLVLLIIHQFLLIVISYLREWLEKLDFIWLKQLDHDRLMIIRQRQQLIQQISLIYPRRMIDFYLTKSSHSSLTQHYHHQYDQMGLLYIHFEDNPSSLIDLINTVEYSLKTNERFSKIVLHRRSTMKDLIFSLDLTSSIEDLIELLFQINEHLQIPLTACIHIGRITEVLIHLQTSPKLDIWSEDLTFLEYLLSKIPLNHCLITSPVYQIIHHLYLFRTAGMIIKTGLNIENNSHVYYLLGRLIGENIFHGRNTLPLTINQLSSRHSFTTDASISSNEVFKDSNQSSTGQILPKILHPPELPRVDQVSNKPLNLARKLIADTSESEVSNNRQPWTRNLVYHRRAASVNNLSKYVLSFELSKFISGMLF